MSYAETLAHEPAYPVSHVSQNNGTGETTSYQTYGGLTKREHIATQIAAGMAAAESESDGYWSDNELAARATRRADALLAELAKPMQS